MVEAHSWFWTISQMLHGIVWQIQPHLHKVWPKLWVQMYHITLHLHTRGIGHLRSWPSCQVGIFFRIKGAIMQRCIPWKFFMASTDTGTTWTNPCNLGGPCCSPEEISIHMFTALAGRRMTQNQSKTPRRHHEHAPKLGQKKQGEDWPILGGLINPSRTKILQSKWSSMRNSLEFLDRHAATCSYKGFVLNLGSPPKFHGVSSSSTSVFVGQPANFRYKHSSINCINHDNSPTHH